MKRFNLEFPNVLFADKQYFHLKHLSEKNIVFTILVHFI